MSAQSKNPSFASVLLYARDSRLAKKSAQSLLYALIMHASPEKQYSCFPGYDLLSDETGLDASTLKPWTHRR